MKQKALSSVQMTIYETEKMMSKILKNGDAISVSKKREICPRSLHSLAMTKLAGLAFKTYNPQEKSFRALVERRSPPKMTAVKIERLSTLEMKNHI